jgi:hypothetical protein
MKERAAGFQQSRARLTLEGVLLRLLLLLLAALMVREWVWMPVLIRGNSMRPSGRQPFRDGGGDREQKENSGAPEPSALTVRCDPTNN